MGNLVGMATTQQSSPLAGIAATFARWGVPFDATDVVPGRPKGAFEPVSVIVHHDAVKGRPGASRKVVRQGRADLPGPLYQIMIGRDLVADVVTLGRANHAGTGGPWGRIGKDSGNRMAVGVCFEHAGTADEVWPLSLTVFGALVVAAVCDHLGVDPDDVDVSVCGHKEYTPRKPDPYALDMDRFRRAVRVRLEAGPDLDQDDEQEDDMQTSDVLRLGPGNAALLDQDDREITVGEAVTGAFATGVANGRKLDALIAGQQETNRLLTALVAAVRAQNGPAGG